MKIIRSVRRLVASAYWKKCSVTAGLLRSCYHLGIPSPQTPTLQSALSFPLLTFPLYIMGLIVEFQNRSGHFSSHLLLFLCKLSLKHKYGILKVYFFHCFSNSIRTSIETKDFSYPQSLFHNIFAVKST